MLIKENWFYIIDDKSDSLIQIENWIYAFLFLHNTSKNFIFELKENSKLDFFSFFSEKSSSILEFHQYEDNSNLKIKNMFFNYKNDLKNTLKSKIWSNNSTSNIEIIWIVKEKKLTLDSGIEIEKNCKKVTANLSQKNIFIWENWQIRWLPKLFVESEDVKASHSCKIEKIDIDKLFYIKSRWISENEAIIMLIESLFIRNFSCIKMLDKKIFQKTYNDFLTLNK